MRVYDYQKKYSSSIIYELQFIILKMLSLRSLARLLNNAVYTI